MKEKIIEIFEDFAKDSTRIDQDCIMQEDWLSVASDIEQLLSTTEEGKVDEQRGTMFNAWKNRHDKEVKKCVCKTPNPRPTDKNNCWDCDGEIYKDYLNKVRWNQRNSIEYAEESKEVEECDFCGKESDINICDSCLERKMSEGQ